VNVATGTEVIVGVNVKVPGVRVPVEVLTGVGVLVAVAVFHQPGVRVPV